MSLVRLSGTLSYQFYIYNLILHVSQTNYKINFTIFHFIFAFLKIDFFSKYYSTNTFSQNKPLFAQSFPEYKNTGKSRLFFSHFFLYKIFRPHNVRRLFYLVLSFCFIPVQIPLLPHIRRFPGCRQVCCLFPPYIHRISDISLRMVSART